VANRVHNAPTSAGILTEREGGNVSATANKQIALSFLHAIEEQDADKIANLLTDDAEYWIPGQPHFPVAGRRSKAEAKAFFAMAKQILNPGFRFTVKSMTAEDDRVSLEASGVGLARNGKTYDNTYHFLFRMRDGKICYVAEYMDTQHVAEVFRGFFP
jgi:ketosteroid isomerase-like protein